MPWKETSRMDEKLWFVAACLRDEEPMTVLCERYGISRQTGYELKRRYLAEGPRGLEERSRAPHRSPQTTPEPTAELIIKLRRKHRRWGPKKLLAILEKQHPGIEFPAASTAGEILKRAGLVESKGRRRRPIPVECPFGAVAQANDAWCIDFKGWFRTRDGTRCDPLTVTDAFSRYSLMCKIMPEQTEPVRNAVDRLFEEYGLPLAMRSDNGPPFGGTGPAGLSRLAVHWLKLGLRLERIVPGKPQQNGQHERFHKTLKEDTACPPAETAEAQQRRFDRFRRVYNDERPHEALEQTPPSAHYRRSPRSMPHRIEEPWYDADYESRRVRHNGEIRWRGSTYYISETLVGEPVGVTETDSGNAVVRFATVDLGIIDPRRERFHPFTPPRPGRTKDLDAAEAAQ